jgi:hypothetical protein
LAITSIAAKAEGQTGSPAPLPVIASGANDVTSLPDAEPAAQKHYLRAVLEHQGLFVLGFLWYVTTTDIRHDWDLGYRWGSFRDKLTGAAIELDTNKFGTNFIGHPLGGTGYYHAARSNGLSIAESFGFAVGGSLLWEYFGEVTEIISANDMVVTPFGGMAIGEPTTQLAAFFDRSSPALGHRVLSTIFAPVRAVNRALDAEPLDPRPPFDKNGFPQAEWHEFRAFALAMATRQTRTDRTTPSPAFGSVGVELSTRLARLPSYDGVGRASLGFGDANLSHLDLRIAAADHGLTDFVLESGFVLGGYYYRRAHRSADGSLVGGGFALGIATSFLYSQHDYDADRTRPKDRISRVTPLGLLFDHRGALGPLRVSGRLDLGLDLGGVQPYALPNGVALDAPGDYEPVTRIHGYYHAIGAHFFSGLELGYESLSLETRLRTERYLPANAFGRSASDPSSLLDTRVDLDGRLRLKLPGTATTLMGYAGRRHRAGRAGALREQRSELSFGGGIGVTL